MVLLCSWISLLGRSLGGRLGALLTDQAFFLERANSLSAKRHRNLLSVYDNRLFLQVRLEGTLGPTQGEADIVSCLLAFTGEFTS